jgi:hypothetical protein
MPQHGRRKAEETLMLALACGATVEAAAAKAGIGRATAHRRLANPEFQNRLKQVQSEMLQRAAATMTAAASESVKTLLVLQQSSVPYTVRLGAAKAILEIGIKIREAADLEERLAALEQHMAANNRL